MTAPTLQFPPAFPDDDAVIHAGDSRGKQQGGSFARGIGVVLMVLLAIEAIHTAMVHEVYYSPKAGTVTVVGKEAVGIPVGAIIYKAGPNIGPSNITLGKMITVIFPVGSIDNLRSSSCATFELYPIFRYDKTYEPPVAGGRGRCLINGNAK